MNRKERKALTSCNKKGLIKLINDPKYAQNKANQFPAIIGYLARHGLPGGSTKEELMDLIYTARSELLAQAAQKHADSNQPFAYDELGLNGVGDARVKEFIRNPIGAVHREMEAFHKRQEDFSQLDADEIRYYQRLKVNADTLAIELKVSADNKTKYESKADMLDVTARLAKKMPEKDADLGASLKRVNSGVFGTLFRRPSKEFAAFEESFKTFRDANRAGSGNVEDLEQKTTAYLKHVIPEFKYSKDMPKQQWLDCLPKGKRARAEFCMNVLESIDEHKKAKPYMDNVEKAVNGKPIDKSVDEPIAKNDVAQKEFQQELQKEVVHDEPKVEEAAVEEQQPEVEKGGLEA